MRKYFYHLKESLAKETTDKTITFHFYISAKPRFTLKELISKQDWLMCHAEDLPFNQMELRIGSCRESCDMKLTFDKKEVDNLQQKLTTSAFRYTYLSLDKIQHKVEIYYDNVLEILFEEKQYFEPILNLLQLNWKGEWKEKEEEE